MTLRSVFNMNPLKKHLIPGIAALAALGAVAPLAAAAAPDLAPFVDDDPSTGSGVGVNKWFVDTSVAGGVYSAHYFHSVQLLNVGADPLEIVPGGAAGGTPSAPVVPAKQNVTGSGLGPVLTGITLVGDQQGIGGPFRFGVQGLVNVSLQPPSGAAIASQLGPVCWTDTTPPASNPGATPVFVSAGCTTAGGAAVGFSSGISGGWADAVQQGDVNGFFNITNVAPGAGTATVAVNGSINDAVPGNNSDTGSVPIPGVIAAAKSAATAGSAVNVDLSAQIVNPQVRGGRGATNATAAAATSALAFGIASGPANGTASISGARLTYTPRAGFTGTDTVTYFAEDSRGLRSAAATVTFSVTGSGGGGGGGGGGVVKVNSGAVGISVARFPKTGLASRLTIGGTVKPAKGVAGCSGRVQVTAKAGKKTVASTTAKLAKRKGACRYTATLALKAGKVGSAKTVRVSARFLGTAKIKARTSPTRVVKIR